MSLQSINPVNGKVIRKYKSHSAVQVEKAIHQTHSVWLKWKDTGLTQRSKLLHNLAELLNMRKKKLAGIMSEEMGKPLMSGIEEIEKCASVCHYYAANARDFLKEQSVNTGGGKSYISFQPLGVVLAVMPWNFPFWQLFRFLAPAFMAGNCALLKHSSNVSGCALAILELVEAAGFPKGAFNVLLIGSDQVAGVIRHPLVSAVTLTGSTEAGIAVAREAGAQLKKTVLELGGSDPYLILEDADLESAARVCAQSRLINNGQSCIAGKRFITVKKIEKEFIRLFRAEMAAYITGDPSDPATQLGPMSRTDLRDELHQQVLRNIQAGAKCILGGKIPDFKGRHAFYTPTILTGIRKGMPAYEEELFGPVALVISAKNTEDAIRIANDTSFGLGAAVFTTDLAKGEEIARCRLNAGSCFVNALVRSDPRLPFGGIKQSGYGRELGLYGIHEFVNIKTVYIA
ncbi:NAD-dependent succinate-semialdehyde dehydrogenase [Pedobacter sp. JY14-1]|uniref:NAD-dependent succinate-semialdehyde dehydrogenase n=1 Tax=Pedobacter sp. JY14-1 TaxID=3034151 RepID=UPI0023E20197|nr:NAD-dependent succinate-semialdehyde dehydrogenase [Pedobacter sp. JY14-1]